MPPRSASPTRPLAELGRGARDALPFLLVVFPFAVLFGAVARAAGLDVIAAMTMSVMVIAGAAQFTALALMQEHAPALLVVASALAVNLRMAMYSASIAPWLGGLPLWRRALAAYFLVDQTYALSIARFEAEPRLPLAARAAYYAGTVLVVCFPWYLGTWIGAVAGAAIPARLGLDFAVPITFIAIVSPMLRTPAHLAAAATSVLAALLLAGLPTGTGLILAGLAAMIVGAEVERRGFGPAAPALPQPDPDAAEGGEP
ncbi:MAG: branched-chain amino acid ABC transporter permease [Alphaproteobacteria bacterium]|nr:MAG: branched-chain amino acid ABC transporter permease [Alphaproteobacteria bacterium]